MHQRDFTMPPPIDYARPPEPSDWPQSECGGVSIVLGFAIIFFIACTAFLHLAFVARDPAASRLLLRIEAGIFATLSGVGVVLAIVGWRQRQRRHSAAVAGLLVNALLFLVSALVFLVA